MSLQLDYLLWIHDHLDLETLKSLQDRYEYETERMVPQQFDVLETEREAV